jgi:hypothetical protein
VPAAVSPNPAGTVVLTDSGCRFDYVSDAIEVGPMVFTFVNQTSDIGAFHLWQLDKSHTFEEFTAFIAEHRRAFDEGLPDTGPPPFATMVGEEVRTDATDTMVVTPSEATYGVACIIPHESAGRLVATYAAGPIVVGPNPAAIVTMRDDGCEFSGPAQLGAGKVVLVLENQSRYQFDADLWLLNSGHSYDELARHIAEEQRRADAGEPGLGLPTFARLVAEASVAAEHGTLRSRLAPGTYGVACILLDGGSPVHIWAAGPFTIAE